MAAEQASPAQHRGEHAARRVPAPAPIGMGKPAVAVATSTVLGRLPFTPSSTISTSPTARSPGTGTPATGRRWQLAVGSDQLQHHHQSFTIRFHVALFAGLIAASPVWSTGCGPLSPEIASQSGGTHSSSSGLRSRCCWPALALPSASCRSLRERDLLRAASLFGLRNDGRRPGRVVRGEPARGGAGSTFEEDLAGRGLVVFEPRPSAPHPDPVTMLLLQAPAPGAG